MTGGGLGPSVADRARVWLDDDPDPDTRRELHALLDAAASGRELAALVARLIAGAGPERRLDELIEKAGAVGLDDDEKQELRELQTRVRTLPRGPG